MFAPTEPGLFWLSATIAFTSVLWIPYIINRIIEHGLWPALRNPNHDDRPAAAWADRLMWAHQNAVENLVVFAPLVLIGSAIDLNGVVALAAPFYFFARVSHAIIYTLGIPLLRTIAFLVGFAAQALLGFAILGTLL